MPATSNVMTVTDNCLSCFSKALIDLREFRRDLITIVGSLFVTDSGVSSNYSSTNFCRRSGFSFKGTTDGGVDPATGETITIKHPIRVSANGQFVSTEEGLSTIFTLIGNPTIPNSTLRVYLTSTYASIHLDGVPVLEVTGMNIQNGDTVQVDLTVSINSISLRIFTNGTSYTGSATPSNVTPSKFTGVFIGLDFTSPAGYEGSPNYWKGSIDLSKFLIYEDSNVYYSPSEQEKIEFTNILVAESNIELNDNTTSIVGLAYEFPIYEISRTKNNLLLRSTIDSESHLTIGKIGLYCTVGGVKRLFSEIKGLSLKKTRDLTYEVTLHVDTNINFVNTTVRPEIVLNEYAPVKKKDIEDIKLIFLGANVRMERAIQRNANSIGYNKAQVFYRYEQDNKMIFDNWFNSTAYMKLVAHEYEPKNFYAFIKNSFNYYEIRDLVIYNNLDAVQVLDNAFTSRTNYVVFNGNATLSVLLNLKDLSDQVILSKIKITKNNQNENVYGDKYFVLSLENLSLKFEFFIQNGYSIPIIAPLDFNDQVAFNSPILINITQTKTENGCTFSLYQNSKLIGTSTYITPIYKNVSKNYFLTNYTDETDINKATINLKDVLFFDKTLTINDFRTLQYIFAISS